MSDIIASAQVLNGAASDGSISSHSSGTVIGVCLKSALTGSLTVTGVTQANGSAQSWVIAPASTGYQAPPGSAKFWGQLNYTLSNPAADAGKAFIAFAPN